MTTTFTIDHERLESIAETTRWAERELWRSTHAHPEEFPKGSAVHMAFLAQMREAIEATIKEKRGMVNLSRR